MYFNFCVFIDNCTYDVNDHDVNFLVNLFSISACHLYGIN